jgi:hypothetical protein
LREDLKLSKYGATLGVIESSIEQNEKFFSGSTTGKCLDRALNNQHTRHSFTVVWLDLTSGAISLYCEGIPKARALPLLR